jgi:tetratricopeptide (TPR) repeat protein
MNTSLSKEYLAGCEALENEDYEDAIHYFSKAIASNPDDIDALIKRADAHLENDDIASCEKDMMLQIEFYTRMLNNHPNDFNLLLKRAEVYKLLLMESKSQKDYEQAIKIKPNTIEAHLGLALLHTFRYPRKLDEAEKIFIQILDWQPENSSALYHLALLYNIKNDYEKSIHFYKKCISGEGDYNFTSYKSLIRIFRKHNCYNEAISWMKKFLIKFTGSPSDYLSLAYLYVYNEEYDEAQLFQTIALALAGEKEHILFSSAQLYAKMKNWRKAIEFMERTIKIDPRPSYQRYKSKLEQNL